MKAAVAAGAAQHSRRLPPLRHNVMSAPIDRIGALYCVHGAQRGARSLPTHPTRCSAARAPRPLRCPGEAPWQLWVGMAARVSPPLPPQTGGRAAAATRRPAAGRHACTRRRPDATRRRQQPALQWRRQGADCTSHRMLALREAPWSGLQVKSLAGRGAAAT